MQRLTHVSAVSASHKRARPSRLFLTIALAGLLGYGLLTAQGATGVTLTKRAFAGVQGGTATLVHSSHVTGISHPFTGIFDITFDRHVDDCSIIAGATEEGGNIFISEIVSVFRTGSNVARVEVSSGASSVDGDFDIIALCPGT